MPTKQITKRYFELFADVNDINLAFADDQYLRDDDGNRVDPEQLVVDEEILFATYEYESYSGRALIIFERDGMLYEVNASHCSCHGLEGQWEPEATSWAALASRGWMRHIDTDYYGEEFGGRSDLVALVRANA